MTFYTHRLFIAGRSSHDLEATASPLHVRRGSDGSCSLTAVGAGLSSLDPLSVQGLSQVGLLLLYLVSRGTSFSVHYVEQ